MNLACLCDAHGVPLVDNPSGLDRIVMRRADWRSIRRALLTARAGEQALADWRPGTTQDLALMVAEWWATLGEVLEFYNDEIANEAFLGTALRPESVRRLISVLGYLPRPALAATGRLAAVVSGQRAINLPAGLAFESVPPPGQQPQIFESDGALTLVPTGQLPVQPRATIASPDSTLLLIEGKDRTLSQGDSLRLRVGSVNHLLTVGEVTLDGKQTRLEIVGGVPVTARARHCRLERPSLSLPVWSFGANPLVGSQLHLAALTRAVAPGDSVLLTAPGRTPILSVVTAVADVIWYANPPGSDPAVSPGANALPVPHSRLTLASPPSGWNAADITIRTGWALVAPLVDQPPAIWTGTPAELDVIGNARSAEWLNQPALLAGADGTGISGTATASAGTPQVEVGVDLLFQGQTALTSPIDLLTNLVAVTRGKTVPREVLGSGDATIAGQTFVLAKAPVSYVRRGAGFASNVTVLVDGVPWREVSSFYGEPSDAAIFVLSEREDGKTQVAFGDGVNGRRLPTGRDNVVARYRYGAGAEMPIAGTLTRLPSPWPQLDKVLNPVGVGGGADAEPSEAIRSYAPQSVLTLGRAVSVADFAAFAAAAATPNRTRTVWAWDVVQQRTMVTIYVAGDAGVRAAVREAVLAVGDPLKPVSVQAAVPVPVELNLMLVLAPGYEAEPILTAARVALTGTDGLFSAVRLGIGQALFMSALSETLIPIPGVLSLSQRQIRRTISSWGLSVLDEPLLRPEDNEWFDLTDERLTIGWEVADG
jgi:hypothetical protein